MCSHSSWHIIGIQQMAEVRKMNFAGNSSWVKGNSVESSILFFPGAQTKQTAFSFIKRLNCVTLGALKNVQCNEKFGSKNKKLSACIVSSISSVFLLWFTCLLTTLDFDSWGKPHGVFVIGRLLEVGKQICF